MNLESFLFSVCLVSSVISLGVLIAFHVIAKMLGTLPAKEPDPPSARVDVIIPARNEQLDLEASVSSLIAQSSVDLSVIIINDHSTDGTGEIADRLASEHPNVFVIHDPPLREGWLGKANAMQHGLERSDAPLVLFSDADIMHRNGVIASALGVLDSEALDFLSLVPKVECQSFWENVLLPHAMVAGIVQFGAGALGRSKDQAAAAGAFMLTKRDVIEEIEGLQSVKSEMLDDVMLARRVGEAGFRTRLLLAPDHLNVRLFKGNRDAFWGLTKNILSVVHFLPMAIPFAFVPLIIYWTPAVACLVGAWRDDPGLVGFGLVAYGLQAALLIPVARCCTWRWRWVFFFPVAAIPVIACISRALILRVTQGAVAWRGRVISTQPSKPAG